MCQTVKDLQSFTTSPFWATAEGQQAWRFLFKLLSLLSTKSVKTRIDFCLKSSGNENKGVATWEHWAALNHTRWSVTPEWHLSIYFSFLSSSYFIILIIGVTNTTSQYYFEHADLHFPADNPRMKSTWMFSHSGCFQQPLPQPYPAPPSQTAAHEGLLRQPKPLKEEIGHFPFYFRVFFFRLDSWSPWRGAVRGTQVGSQAGREALLVSGQKPWWGGGREQGCAGHISPWTLEGRSSKALDTKRIQLFTFVILQ